MYVKYTYNPSLNSYCLFFYFVTMHSLMQNLGILDFAFVYFCTFAIVHLCHWKLLRLWFVSFTICQFCDLSVLRFVSVAICQFCDLAVLQFVSFSIWPVLWFVSFAIYQFCETFFESHILYLWNVWKYQNFHHASMSNFWTCF